MNYRQGRIEDLDNIISLLRGAIARMEAQGIYQWDELYPTEDDFKDDIAKENLYVVFEENELVALYVISGESDEAYKSADWKSSDNNAYILHRFCVGASFQNKGYGKRILTHIESQIKDMGYSSVRLDVFTQNPFAQRLYRDNGYKERGVANWRKGRFDLMEKII